MEFTYHFVLVVFCVSVVRSSIYSNLKENLLSYLKSVHKSTPLPQQEGQIEVAQPSLDGIGVKVQNPTLLQFVRVEPKKESVNDDLRITLETDDQNIEDANVDDSNPLQSKQDGIDTGTERIQQWATKPSLQQKKDVSFDLNNAVRDLVISQLHLTDDPKDSEVAKIKSNILKNAKKRKGRLNKKLDSPTVEAGPKLGSEIFQLDPVLNMLRSQNYRRQKDKDEDSDDDSGSSERDLMDWKDEFKQDWLHKKYEALNQTRAKGDSVNMVAARPWGVHCGDPGQHDLPWGTCMLAMECEPEFRIYRGDIFCGRTQFVCCSLQVTTYDMYQGFDVSFDDKSLSTDTEEKKAQKKDSAEERKKKEAKDKKKRKEARGKRVKKIKKTIAKVTKEIVKILDKVYKNGTKARKKRTKQLKKFIKALKKQFKKDRLAVKDVHEKDMVHLDNRLLLKLNQIRELNQNFMKNETFREIVVNGTLTKQGARMLVEAYPELDAFMNKPKDGRRAPQDDALEYDIEYGFMYY
ncbi:uncharacterized protein LOC126375273 [Pectinophora gossypiella]|uniref:uncharacterized protein LOC126375273 n=1 Tax=Pectinophora gossypiella TaxID=13191 RepID=UPI00214F60FC|nr:uncharacterized protein LOC126375273 [Pectinophora gossypiella]